MMKDFPVKPGYVEIPHPADISIAVTAVSLESVFSESLIAMQELAGVKILEDGTQSEQFSISGMSNEILLVTFLNEVNFMRENGFWPTFTKIEIKGPLLKCSYLKAKCEKSGYEIKAVTFSEMKIKNRGEYWYTKIVFDV